MTGDANGRDHRETAQNVGAQKEVLRAYPLSAWSKASRRASTARQVARALRVPTIALTTDLRHFTAAPTTETRNLPIGSEPVVCGKAVWRLNPCYAASRS